jgi:alpha-beta hydrolase superfamily lysophospholipase
VSPPASARPVYLDAASEPIFGFFHAPADSSPRRLSVLICAPFAWDDVASYRPRREWAEQLASAGHPTLRFDWPGTGDSGGSPRDPRRLEAWTDAVGAAVAWLRLTAGDSRVAAMGLGLGGLVAWRAVSQGVSIDDLVLWAVPARGRQFVRELEMFGRLQAASAPAGAPAAPPSGPACSPPAAAPCARPDGQ